MSQGELWELPGGHRAIETDGSTPDTLRVMILPPGWPWFKPPQTVPRALCTRLPMRYHGGAAPETGKGPV
jgi:hypothetical protein